MTSFVSDYKILLDSWDYEKNTVSPSETKLYSHQKIWLKCDKGHSYEQVPYLKLKGIGCPYCSNNKVLEGFNDLKTTNPEILNLWDNKKNKNLLPSMFSYGSTKKVWWKCSNGHSWNASIYSVVNGNRCPYCSHQKVLRGYNDLETMYPDLVQYWDFTKNEIQPFEVFSKSNRKVWWKCDKGHSYLMSINSKTRGNIFSCPICNKYKRISVSEKLIYFYIKGIYPDVVENYMPDWLKPKEIDIYIPSINLGIEYDGFRYHQDIKNDKDKDELCFTNGIKLLRIRELGCPTYDSNSTKINLIESYSQSYSYLEFGIKKIFEYLKLECEINIVKDLPQVLKIINIGNKENCIAITNPEILDEWDYEKNEEMNIIPFNVTKGTSLKAFWKCDKGHSYQASIEIKINQHTGCPYCAGKKVLKGFNDIESQYPELMKEWDYENNTEIPSNVEKGHRGRLHWICKNGHRYTSTIGMRLAGCNCPVCSGHQLLTGFNDIESQYPELMKEWDYEKNNNLNINPRELKKGSSIKAFWKCDKGHSYQSSISDRVHGSGCPYCAGKKILKGFNDIESQYPELMKEWDYEKNIVNPDSISIGSHLKVWWKCSKGHSFDSTISHRLNGTRCPYCAHQKVLRGYNDLATTDPDVLSDWDYEKNSINGITPFNISRSYSKKVWWKCPSGHSYQREVYNQRNTKKKCKICSSLK